MQRTLKGDTYLDLFNHSNCDIFIIGNIDFNRCETIIKDKFKFRTLKKEPVDTIIKHNSIRKRAKKVVEEEKIAQSKLAIGCKIGKINDFERNYVLTLYNIILSRNSLRPSRVFRFTMGRRCNSPVLMWP